MTKTKSQLRAEAMERLKNSAGARFSPDAAVIAIVGGRIGQVDWSLECDKLIDLLTDDCDTECYECAKLAELVAENSQLRVEVDELTAELEDSEYDCATCAAKNDLQDAYDDMVDKRNELLVRLDEMADRKCPGYDPELHYCRYHAQDFELNRQTVIRLKRENADLQSQLESAHEKNRSLRQHIGKMQEGRHGWHLKGAKLESENAKLRDKLGILELETVAKDGLICRLHDEVAELTGKLRAAEETALAPDSGDGPR